MFEDLKNYEGDDDKTPAFVDWRDTAVYWVLWGASAFVGLLFGGFASRGWGFSAVTSIAIGVVVTFAAHWLMTQTSKALI